MVEYFAIQNPICGIQEMRSWGFAPSFSAQVRLGEPGPPVPLLKGSARSEVKPQVPRLPPDFLSDFAASVNLVRLSLKKSRIRGR
jgi:hypothetical protein